MIGIKMGTIEEKVLDIICDIMIERIKRNGEEADPKIKSSDIYDRCDLEKLQVYNAMRRLSRKGIIYSGYRQYAWFLTSFGDFVLHKEWDSRKKQLTLKYQLKLD